MRIGIFGGTFDPVHFGHLILAESCREAGMLDQVRFIPAARSPFKPDAEMSPGKARAEMLELATAGVPEFVVDKREIKRDGISYTVETLEALRAEFPEDQLFLLMGADSLADFPKWKEPARILQLANIIAVNRGGESEPSLDHIQSELSPDAASRIQIATMVSVAISSTELRLRAKLGKSIRFQTPRPVERYVETNGLYRS